MARKNVKSGKRRRRPTLSQPVKESDGSGKRKILQQAVGESGLIVSPRARKPELQQTIAELRSVVRSKAGIHKLKQAVSELPDSYPALLESIKDRIRAAQIKASLAVNRELIQLYWDTGKEIVERQRAEFWGDSVVERLSIDVRQEFPAVAGFSPRNIWRMRAFYLAWTDEIHSGPPEHLSAKFLTQAASELDGVHLPQSLSEIPWFHNVVLLEKLEDPSTRLWYAQQTIANGWSRSMLVHWIESGLHERQGQSINNFAATLPKPQSDLAAELIRDPYNFDFLTLATDAAERDLENGLLDHIRKFLIELGAGFAFVGQQLPITVARSKIVAEYALRDLAKPVGFARYITRLVESLPEHLRGNLPTIEQLEAELNAPSSPTKHH